MKIQNQETLRWSVILGLAGFLAVGGCSTKNVTVGSSGGTAPSEEVVKPMEVVKAQPGEKPPATPRRELLDVYFAYDKWSLSPEGKKNLAQNVDALKQHPENKLLIEGHCDERGTTEYNLALGAKRARAALDYLVSLGIPAARIRTTSYGEELPLCKESTENCYEKNRRDRFVEARSRPSS